MMGRLNQDQGQLFYSFCLEDVVPADHRVREIAAVLDLSWVHGELAPYYSPLGRPSIDPVLMIRMLILGYVFAIRSERLLCREVQVNLAYLWFCGLSIEDKILTYAQVAEGFYARWREGSSDAMCAPADDERYFNVDRGHSAENICRDWDKKISQ